MTRQHLSALDFDILIGNTLVKIESMSASINDERKATPQGGVPNGFVGGAVECTGDVEVDSMYFGMLVDVASAAGSWQDMPTFDIIMHGETASGKQRIELFGCLLNISDLLNLDGKGGEKTKHKLSFTVTSPDFVKINGVPYLSKKATRDLQ